MQTLSKGRNVPDATESRKLMDEVVRGLASHAAVIEDRVGEDGFEATVWQLLWTWVHERCCPGGPWAESTAGSVLLTSHEARKERDADEWERFQAPPDKLADALLPGGSFSRVDLVLRSPNPKVSIGIEIERLKMGKKKPKAEPFIHGLGQAMLALTRRDWAVLVVYWPTTGPADGAREERQRLRDSLEGLFRDGRLRIVIVP